MSTQDDRAHDLSHRTMPTEILIAPAAGGKTRACLARVYRASQAPPQPATRVVLPSRLQCAAFRRQLAALGGALGPHVGTFPDLYRALLVRAGQPYPLASDPIVYRLVRAAIRDAVADDGLDHYTPIADAPGLASELRERFAELKQARVLPETVLGLADEEGAALSDLARIYAAYQNRLLTEGWADREGLSWLAVEALEDDPGLAGEIDLLVVDSFDSFTGAQLAALRLLDETIPEIVLTLPGTPAMDRPAHRRFARSLARVRAALPEAALVDLSTAPGPRPGSRPRANLPALPDLPRPLRHLEAALFDPAAAAREGDGRVTFLETRTPVDEAREALRWVKARVVRDGLHAPRCALVTPDPERYRQYLRAAAAEFGLQLRFTHGEALTSAPGVAALLDLLALPGQNWPRRLTIEAVHAPYFDLSRFGLTPRDANALELVSLSGPVIGGLDQWEAALTHLAGLESQPQGEEDEHRPTPILPVGPAAEALWEGLRALARRLAPPGPQPSRAWVGWLEDALAELRFFERQETARDRAAALGLRETLRALALGEQVTGPAPVGYETFLQELLTALAGTNFLERPPAGQPSVLVLRVIEARGLRFDALAVLGLSEGMFPEVEREDPFLSETVRSALGLDPMLDRGQAGLFYQAATRADRYLLLSRPTLADDGERWEPSPYWTAARALITGQPTLIRPDDPRPLAEAASPEEALTLAVRRGSLPGAYGDLAPRFTRLRHARTVLEARLAETPDSPFEGDLAVLADHLAAAYGPDHDWSPTRLESYGQCAHMFFASQTLGLEAHEPPEPGPAPHQLGSLLHEILERAYQEATDPADPQAVLDALYSIAETAFAGAPERYGFRPSPLWEVERDFLLERLADTVRELAALEGGWRPVAFERVFGRKGEPPLLLAVGDQRIRLAGVIDRLDANADGQLRVIDYKTGSSKLGTSDLVRGDRLQLPLYAQAAERALGLGEPVEGLYWAILAARPGSLRLSRFSHQEGETAYRGPAGALQVALGHVARILAGVQEGAFPPTPPAGGCPAYCPAAAWCWRYEPAGW